MWDDADYSDGLLHGECVAIGMVLESNLARALGLMHPSAVGRVIRCIQARIRSRASRVLRVVAAHARLEGYDERV